jgi:hypothetical protein
MRLASRDDDGQATYACGDEPTRCGPITRSKGQAAGRRLNLDGVAQSLADGVGAEGDVAALPVNLPPGCAPIG